MDLGQSDPCTKPCPSRCTNRCLPSAILVLAMAGPTMAADHLEAPALSGRGDVDIADIYAFQSPDNADNAVLIMTVNPFAGQISGSDFSTTASYVFEIDNDGDAVSDISYVTTFGAASGGTQSLTTTRQATGGAATPFANGLTGQDIDVGPGRVRADLFDDPFFFDLAGFQNGFAFTGEDAFAGANVSAIVLEVPRSELGSDSIGVWATTREGDEQIDRMGRPAINTALIPSASKDAFNQASPDDDSSLFASQVEASLLALSGNPSLAASLTGVLLPDILTFDSSNAGGFLNGRRLEDDVMDAVLNLVSDGAVTTDFVDANDVAFLDVFPYLAMPNAMASVPTPPAFLLVMAGLIAAVKVRKRQRG